MILYDSIDSFVFIIRGTKTACFDPDSDLLNDKYLENNNCESFGKARLAHLSPPASGYLEREISVSNAINFRSDWEHRMSDVFCKKHFPILSNMSV